VKFHNFLSFIRPPRNLFRFRIQHEFFSKYLVRAFERTIDPSQGLMLHRKRNTEKHLTHIIPPEEWKFISVVCAATEYQQPRCCRDQLPKRLIASKRFNNDISELIQCRDCCGRLAPPCGNSGTVTVSSSILRHQQCVDEIQPRNYFRVETD
jgi:hypothetical protein